ncbi:MAG TPA: glutaminyl-peptide cyclotransferase [Verrucomicrobiae bacterium]|nr:glutaminyl-peptide cyclotransferase [Verrucomicrobiae bacterium]
MFALVCANVSAYAGPVQEPDTSKQRAQPQGSGIENRGASTGGNTAASTNFTLYTYEVVHTWPHDRRAFTQGLVFLDGQFIESTGLNGQSTLRRVDLATGMVIKEVEIPSQYFAEGLAVLNGKAFQLTWQNHKGFVYDLKSFRSEGEFSYSGEGWGLTTDGHSLILSDGTSQIRFVNPETFKVERTINVTHRTWPVDHLNELEFIKGEIFANIWGADYVVRINPLTGFVSGAIDFSGLLSVQDRAVDTDVLNGIAYDSVGDRLFVTGKRWPKMFEVRLKPK